PTTAKWWWNRSQAGGRPSRTPAPEAAPQRPASAGPMRRGSSASILARHAASVLAACRSASAKPSLMPFVVDRPRLALLRERRRRCDFAHAVAPDDEELLEHPAASCSLPRADAESTTAAPLATGATRGTIAAP